MKSWVRCRPRCIQIFDKTGLNVWLGNFLNWAQSDTLQKLWPRLRINYQPSTIHMTEALFAAANEIKALRVKQGQVSYDDYQIVIAKLAIVFQNEVSKKNRAAI
jgi:hypothetical protein